MPSGWRGWPRWATPRPAIGRIHAPVGLNIEAVTAPEIALSILAEVVAARRGAALARGAPRAATAARRMIFGPTPLEEARGAILAHTIRLTGKVLKKGTVLDQPAIAALQAGRPSAASSPPGWSPATCRRTRRRIASPMR